LVVVVVVEEEVVVVVAHLNIRIALTATTTTTTTTTITNIPIPTNCVPILCLSLCLTSDLEFFAVMVSNHTDLPFIVILEMVV